MNGSVATYINKLHLSGPTHQKWSNFAIFGFIVQFDRWVRAHLWEKKLGFWVH